MIKISLSKQQKEELEAYRKHASSKDSEKALMVLLSDDGKKVPEIAISLKRHPHTIRDWLKRYKVSGIQGLSRNYSPGRPDEKRSQVKEHITKILNTSPVEHGYQDNVWSVPLITHDATLKLRIDVSPETVTRALKSLGYSYKRPSKTVPVNAPTKEEKLKQLNKLIAGIKDLLSRDKTEIYTLDESHFSSEPYLVRGWFKKRWPPQDPNESTAKKSHHLWLLESCYSKILLEEVKQVRQ